MSRARSFSKLINKDNYATYSGSDSVTDISAVSLPQGTLNFRNKIINGDMRIAQRGTTGTTPSTKNYLLDRFSLSRYGGYPDNATQSQDTDSPSGHLKSLKFIRNSGHSLTGANASALAYAVEGNDIYHFNWGSSSAKEVTLSFWVKSNKTGNFSLILTDANSAYDIGKLYTILEPNTWEHKKVSIEAPTSGGTFNTDNTIGFWIYWGFGATDSSRTAQGSTWGVSNTSGTSKSMVTGASTSLATDSGATFYITGVQLEEGTVPTPFEHRPYGTELALCQRYFYIFDSTGLDDLLYFRSPYATGTPPNTTASVAHFHPVTMRASPDIIATVNGGTINRKTSSNKVVVFQMASTNINGAYAVTSYTANAEL